VGATREVLRRALRAGAYVGERDDRGAEDLIDTGVRLLAAAGGRAVCVDDPEYPARLRLLKGAPEVVFLTGRWNLPKRVVTIVGSRSATADACDLAEELAASLARNGIAILSGLARGIDAAAHRGALRAGGLSGAVLGTGLNEVYPPEHVALQRELQASVGLLTERFPGSSPTRSTFAMRNRLLAALADAVILVQAGKKSGALHTTEAAKRLGRKIGAYPWDVFEPLAAGTNEAIRRGATLVRGPADVRALLKGKPHSASDAPSRNRREREPKEDPARVAVAELGPRETMLLHALRRRPQPLESAATQAKLTFAEAGAAFGLLEVLGLACREPGGAVRLTRGR